ncbi:MAG: UDP-N-acetylmuramate dehydrogenase [Rickettsiales bacterium]|nr:UDP-N-acetylmuramate dehydrogenase [Rickettsiales bacterium]
MMQHSNDDILSDLPEVRGSYRLGVDLSKINWFNVGGKADAVFRPHDVRDLAFFLKHKPEHVPVTILGVGSNLLVRDGGIQGVVIRLGRNFAKIKRSGSHIIAGAGALDFNVATFCQQNALTGLEFLVGIPGTIGGAVAMNAGAYASETAGVLERVEAVDEMGEIVTLQPRDIGFVYRGNTLPESMIFTEAVFKVSEGDAELVQARMDEITNARAETQPVRSKTSGSTFKNPQGMRAWKLIDDAGCRGLRIGDAQVSEKHCNFFINLGNATASDIEALGEEVRERVHQKTGVLLEWEVKIIGRKK